MVIYEWEDAKYLGKVTDPTDNYLPVSNINILVVSSIYSLRLNFLAENVRLHS
jgi:hypothetical protein